MQSLSLLIVIASTCGVVKKFSCDNKKGELFYEHQLFRSCVSCFVTKILTLGSTGDEVIYEGKECSYVISGLAELTDYDFKLRAWTEGDEESAVSGVVKATTFRAGRITLYCVIQNDGNLSTNEKKKNVIIILYLKCGFISISFSFKCAQRSPSSFCNGLTNQICLEPP